MTTWEERYNKEDLLALEGRTIGRCYQNLVQRTAPEILTIRGKLLKGNGCGGRTRTYNHRINNPAVFSRARAKAEQKTTDFHKKCTSGAI